MDKATLYADSSVMPLCDERQLRAEATQELADHAHGQGDGEVEGVEGGFVDDNQVMSATHGQLTLQMKW